MTIFIAFIAGLGIGGVVGWIGCALMTTAKVRGRYEEIS